MRMLHGFCFVLLLSTMFSCAGVVVGNQARHYYEPSTNTTIKKNVGEPIVMDGWGYDYDCSYVAVKEPFVIEKNGWPIKYRATVPAGDYIIHKNYDNFRGTSYLSKTPVSFKTVSRITGSEGVEDYDLCIILDDDGSVKSVQLKISGLGFDVVGGPESIVYEKVAKTCLADASPRYGTESHIRYLKRELIYNGVTGSVVHLLYREYANDFARVAYYQDLVYDLDKSDIIGFRGTRIRIKSADNMSIEYEVLNYFM